MVKTTDYASASDRLLDWVEFAVRTSSVSRRKKMVRHFCAGDVCYPA